MPWISGKYRVLQVGQWREIQVTESSDSNEIRYYSYKDVKYLWLSVTHVFAL